jgi:hypothetical protein
MAIASRSITGMDLLALKVTFPGRFSGGNMYFSGTVWTLFQLETSFSIT